MCLQHSFSLRFVPEIYRDLRLRSLQSKRVHEHNESNESKVYHLFILVHENSLMKEPMSFIWLALSILNKIAADATKKNRKRQTSEMAHTNSCDTQDDKHSHNAKSQIQEWQQD